LPVRNERGGEHEHPLAVEVRVLTRLQRASSRLWGMRSLNAGLDEMLTASMELLGANFGNVQLYDARRGVLTVAVHRGFGPAFLDAFREVGIQRTTRPAAGRCAPGAGPHRGCRNRPALCPIPADRARRRVIAPVLSTPLTGRDGAPLGMISVHFRAPHRPRETERQAMTTYARRAADFIERCRLEEALELKEEHLRLALRARDWASGAADLGTDTFTWSPDCRRILGFPADGDITHDQFLAAIHPTTDHGCSMRCERPSPPG
jgi:GAF domain-containing protein